MKEAGLRQTVKPLGVFIVDADIVGQRVPPRAHIGRDHGEIERALLAFQGMAQFMFSRVPEGGTGVFHRGI